MLKESRLKSEGAVIRTLSPLRRFRQGPSYSPNRLVSQSASLRSDLYKAVKGLCTRPIDLWGTRKKQEFQTRGPRAFYRSPENHKQTVQYEKRQPE